MGFLFIVPYHSFIFLGHNNFKYSECVKKAKFVESIQMKIDALKQFEKIRVLQVSYKFAKITEKF